MFIFVFCFYFYHVGFMTIQWPFMGKPPFFSKSRWWFLGKTLRDHLTARWLEFLDPEWVDVFPIKNGDISASYVSLPEGSLIADIAFNCMVFQEADREPIFVDRRWWFFIANLECLSVLVPSANLRSYSYVIMNLNRYNCLLWYQKIIKKQI